MRKRLDYTDFQSVLEIFIEESQIHYECTVTGTHNKGNKAADRLYEIWRAVKDQKIDGKRLVDALIDSEQLISKNWIAAIALDMHYQVEPALSILETIAKTSEDPSIRFTVKMTIKTWKEQGWLYKVD